MRFLLDTHLLIWAALDSERLPAASRRIIENSANVLLFSAVSLSEIAIKLGLGRPDFQINPHLLRRGLLDNAYAEIAVMGHHALAVANLPRLRNDPFDRLLLVQAMAEGASLMTANEALSKYSAPIQRV
jgi:PIN domain nuclease of toxin-antitoxin system